MPPFYIFLGKGNIYKIIVHSNQSNAQRTGLLSGTVCQFTGYLILKKSEGLLTHWNFFGVGQKNQKNNAPAVYPDFNF